MDFTVIIPHRGNGLGLWATIHSVEEEMRNTPNLSHNFVIVTNGEPVSPEVEQTLAMFEKSGRLLKHIHSDAPLTPPAARAWGAEVADGKHLAFFDNHCLVARNYFARADAALTQFSCDMLHSSAQFFSGHPLTYEYQLRLAYNFWGTNSTIPQSTYKPYRVAAGGHGGIFVRKDVWDAVGGYGPSDLFVGYGGEELIFDLKLWRYGYQVWLDPKLIHYHYAGNRGYPRHHTDDYYVNMMVSAFVIGGEPWLFRVYESFASGSHARKAPYTEMFELMERAHQRGAQYAREVDSRSKYTLDELLTKFRLEQVAM